VYGISFPDKKMLKEYQEFMRLAAERDHRKLGMVSGACQLTYCVSSVVMPVITITIY